MTKSFIPQLRFKGFNDKWKNEFVTNLFEIKTGGDIDKSNFQKEQCGDFIYPVYANSICLNGLQGYSKIYKFKEKCITITARGTIGFCKVRFEKFYPIVRLLVCLPKNPKFNILYFEKILSKIDYLKNKESTGVPQLTVPTLKKILISYSANIKEQTKIADFFSIIDKKIELTKQKLALLEQQKEYYLNNMFADENSYPQLRFKGFNTLFEEKKLSYLIYIFKKTKRFASDAIENGNFTYFTNNANILLLNEYDLEDECIIGNTGGIAQFNYFNGKFAYMSDCIVFKTNLKSIILTKFIYFYLKNKQKYINNNFFYGTGLKHLNKNMFLNFNLIFPTINEQTKIAQFFTMLDKKIELTKQKLALLEQQKEYYLNNMFV